MNDVLLEVKDLHVNFKIFEGTLKVLNGINLKLYRGERIGIVGEAGCGKTTTMKSIIRILPIPPAIITKGKILYNGNDILKMNSKDIQKIRKNDISMIFEDPFSALNPVFTVGTQIKDVIANSEKNHKKKDKKSIENRAIQILNEVLLPDPSRLLKNYPVQLSGGMRQRICIAMGLVGSKPILLADEPGTSLDVTIKDQIFRLLKTLVGKRNISIILVSSSLGELREMTDRIYVMYAGTIIEMSDTLKILSQPLHPYTKGLLSSTPRLTGKGIGSGINGNIPSYLKPPLGCRFYQRCNNAIPICKYKEPPFSQVDKNHYVACFLYKNNCLQGNLNEK